MRRRFTVNKSPDVFSESILWEVKDHVGEYNPYCVCYARVRAKSIAAALNAMEAAALQTFRNGGRGYHKPGSMNGRKG